MDASKIISNILEHAERSSGSKDALIVYGAQIGAMKTYFEMALDALFEEGTWSERAFVMKRFKDIEEGRL